MNQSILLIGSNGQVGTELRQILTNVTPVTRPQVDLSQPDTLRQIIQKVQPTIIINAAAYTAVDKAESEPELATAINAQAPQVLASEAEKLGAYLIHLSTDYVFNGQGYRPYEETQTTNPLSIYGQTKLAGEEAIRETCTHHLILRTAWVYGVHGKSNFVKTMLRIGRERSEIRVVTDQIGSPTWAKDIAAAIAQLIPLLTPEMVGTYHYTNSGVASWYDFAVAILEEAYELGFGLQVQRIIPISTIEYPTPAIRPHFSVLDCGKISTVLATYPLHWRVRLRQMLKELKINDQ
jgi:dTDP-4-dehydrorhamnose reductase